MAQKISAHQAYSNSRSGNTGLIAATEAMLKAGDVQSVTKNALEKTKAKGFKEFVAKWNIPVVDAPVGGGGNRGGLVATINEFASGNTGLVALGTAYVEAGKKLAEALKPFNRSLSPGYIRKPEPATNGASAPSNAPAKSAAPQTASAAKK